MRRIAIIGAGPIGLEAALFATIADFDVQLFEKGCIAENVLDWGHVRLFSPFSMNASEWGKQAIAASNAESIPDDHAQLTGRQFAEGYLLPLSQLPQLKGRIFEHTRVKSIGRSRTWKHELIGRQDRALDPFQMLVEDSKGERLVSADFVLDCSGTYPNHNWVGAGGMICPGETQSLKDDDYRIPDVIGRDRDQFLNKRVMVIGSGHSAATTVVHLARLSQESASTSVVWLTRRAKDSRLSLRESSADRAISPLSRIENDELVERDQLTETANRLAVQETGPVEWLPGSFVRYIERATSDGAYSVTIDRFDVEGKLDSTCEITVDQIVANVGYRPDRNLYEELQIHECYATQGPIKLAAKLLGETSTNCLDQSGHGADALLNPEPGFFILGSKSYGRNSQFLLRLGIEQIRDVFALVSETR